MNKKRIILMGGCLLLAFLSFIGITQFTSKDGTTTVVVADEDIKVGDLLTEENISEIEVGSYGLDMSTVNHIEDVVGTYANKAISEGDYIKVSKISNIEELGEEIYQVKEGYEIMSVSVDIATGVTGLLQEGDVVTVIDVSKNEIPDGLKYVEVISINQNNGLEVDPDNEENDTGSVPATVTLQVKEDVVTTLGEINKNNAVHLALAYRGDDPDGFIEEGK
jgi:Flp pilus assembly protein CpaB